VWVGVGAFIAGEGDGSALGVVARPNQRAREDVTGVALGDVGGLASSRSKVKTEWAGEGSLVFPLGGLATVDANFQRQRENNWARENERETSWAGPERKLERKGREGWASFTKKF
jgi:hypothetical protein